MSRGIRYIDTGRHTGTCEQCGTTSTTTVTVMEPPGIPAWTCKFCGRTQEPPARTEETRL